MQLRIKQFLAIAGLTALETMRQPIAFILAGSCFAVIALLPLLSIYTLNESARMVRDSALAMQFVTGLVLGAYAACATLNHEIRRGTVSAILSKPVDRELFFLAKFGGIALVMLLFSAGAILATLMSTRTAAVPYFPDWRSGLALPGVLVAAIVIGTFVNYRLKRPFVSNAFGLMLAGIALVFVASSFVDRDGEWVRFGQMLEWRIVPAGILIAMAILVLTGIGVSLATRLDVVPTLTICSVIFLIGLMSDYLLGRFADESAVAALLYAIVPNWQHFWGADALAREGIPATYLLSAGVYGLVYLAGVLCLGTVAFRHMEVRA